MNFIKINIKKSSRTRQDSQKIAEGISFTKEQFKQLVKKNLALPVSTFEL